MGNIGTLLWLLFFVMSFRVGVLVADDERHYDINETYAKEGVCYEKDSDIPCNGVVHDAHEDGATHEWYTKNGILYKYKAYTNNKRLFIEDIISDHGKGSRTVTKYYKDGEKQTVYYENDKKVKWEWYRANGYKKFVNRYKDDKPDGEWLDYWENGNVSRRIIFSNNAKDYLVNDYFGDGSLNYVENVEDEKPIYKTYYWHCNDVEKSLMDGCKLASTAKLRYPGFWDGVGFVNRKPLYEKGAINRLKIEYYSDGDKTIEAKQEREVYENSAAGGVGIVWRDVDVIFEASW